MKNLKKLTALILIAAMLFTSFTPAALAASAPAFGGWAADQNVANFQMTEVQPLPFTIDDFFNKPSTVWADLTSGIAPATFSSSYTLADGVTELNSKTSSAARNAIAGIASADMLLSNKTNMALEMEPNKIIAEGGYVNNNVLKSALGQNIENGTVVFDKETGTAFKVTAPFSMSSDSHATEKLKDTYMVATPQLNEVIKEFNFGGSGEVVQLTPGNFTVEDDIARCLTPAAKAQFQLLAAGPSNFKHVQNHQFPFPLEFDSGEFTFIRGSGGTVKARLTGGLSIGDLKLVGHYSFPFGSYEAALQFKQEFYLTVDLMADLHEEAYLLLAGIEVPFVIGSVKGGLYLVIGIDGEFRLEIAVREWTTPKMGVGGATFLCIPATIHPVFSLGDKGIEGDVNLSGRLNAYAKIGPMIDIIILGVELVGAGAFVGAGVEVKAFEDAGDKLLDIDLYGIIDIYVKAFGKKFQLIYERPSILHKTKKDTGGYTVEIVDCYAYPGRVGGRIVKDPPIEDAFGEFVPVPNVPYRVRAEGPSGTRYFYAKITGASPAERVGSTEDKDVSAWPKTNARGEFFQGDGLYGKDSYGNNLGIEISELDQIYIDFYKEGGGKYSSHYMTPAFPFNSFKMFDADWFNSYATGQIDPQHLRDWTKGPDDITIAYFAGEIVSVVHEMGRIGYWQTDWSGWQTYVPDDYTPSSAPALVKTDAWGCFDTRKPFVHKDKNGATITNSTFSTSGNFPNSVIMAAANEHFKISLSASGRSIFCVTIDHERLAATIPLRKYCSARMAPLIFSQEITPVEGSTKKQEMADGTIVDSIQYDEYIYITNPSGKRAVTAAEISLGSPCYSYADSTIPEWVNTHFETPYRGGFINTSPGGYKVATSVKNGKGHTLLSRRITVEWVWQVHPDPVVITSDDHVELTTAGGVFQVTADGLFPAYSLTGAPLIYNKPETNNNNTGNAIFTEYSPTNLFTTVKINRDTGLMTVPAGLAPGEHKFTVSAVQDYRPIDGYPYDFKGIDKIFIGDPANHEDYSDESKYTYDHLVITSESLKGFYGHDPMPPDEQEFTLTITEAATEAVTEEPPTTAEAPIITFDASNTLEITAEPVAPVIEELTAPVITVKEQLYLTQQSSSLQIPYTLAGGAPDTVTVSAMNQRAGFNVDSGKKFINVPPNLAVGSFIVTVTAKNSAGESSAVFTVEVTSTATATTALKAPMISFKDTKLAIKQGAALKVPYTNTGGEPDTVAMEAKDMASGASASSHIVLDARNALVDIGARLPAGDYTVTVTAANRAGTSSATFTLTVEAAVAVAGVAPVIANEKHGYNFEVTVGGQNLNITVSASGTAPITWSLQEYKDAVPGFITINPSTGALSISSRAAAGIYYFNIQAKNDYGADTRMCTVTVKEERTAPKITNTMYVNKMTQGIDYSMTFSATGSSPLTWSLEPLQVIGAVAVPVPDEASIDNTGKLSIKGSIKAGTYSFIVKVANSVGSDSFEFSITVQSLIQQLEPIRLPGISLSAVASSSLALLSSRAAASIKLLSADTGQTATYGSGGAIKAADPSSLLAGSLQYDVTTVNTTLNTGLKYQAQSHLGQVEAERWWKNFEIGVTAAGSLPPEPLNICTIRWDDDRDVYTNDRTIVNGAAFITWNASIKVYGISSDFGEQKYIINNAYHSCGYMPYTDEYLEEIARQARKAIEDYMNSRLTTFTGGWNSAQDAAATAGMYLGIGIGPDGEIIRPGGTDDDLGLGGFGGGIGGGLGGGLGGGGIGGGLGDWFGGGFDGGFDGGFGGGRLDYGSTLDALAAQKGGLHTVTLNETTGTTVTGKYFAEGLKGNPTASLAFIQDGAVITFAGKDVGSNVSMNMLYNFGFYQNSAMEEQMLALAGATGGQHFAYSFTHHGALPGMATFAIATNIPEGAKVSVYKYDAKAEDFSQIANNITVGANGVVTYRNNTMSDYLITTEQIPWAAATAVSQVENGNFMERVAYGGVWKYFVIALLVLIIAAAVVYILLNKKKKQALTPQ